MALNTISEIVGRSNQQAISRQQLAGQNASTIIGAGLKSAANDISLLSAISAARAREAQINKTAAEISTLKDEMEMKRQRHPLELARLKQIMDQSAVESSISAARGMFDLEHAQRMAPYQEAAAAVQPAIAQENLKSRQLANQSAELDLPVKELQNVLTKSLMEENIQNLPELLALQNLGRQAQMGQLEETISGQKWNKASKYLVGVNDALKNGNEDRALVLYNNVKPLLAELVGYENLPDKPSKKIIDNLIKFSTATTKHLQDMEKTGAQNQLSALKTIFETNLKKSKHAQNIRRNIRTTVRSDLGGAISTEGYWTPSNKPEWAPQATKLEQFLYDTYGEEFDTAWNTLQPYLKVYSPIGVNFVGLTVPSIPGYDSYEDEIGAAWEKVQEKYPDKYPDSDEGKAKFYADYLQAAIMRLFGNK